MDILNDISKFPKHVSLILGFFDGIHAGHRKVINSAVNFARENCSQTVLITFKEAPAIFFKKDTNFKYIYPRHVSYGIAKKLGVDYIVEISLEDMANMSAIDYLENYLVRNYEPISISTGYNHTFGINKTGNSEFLYKNQEKFCYKYFPAELQMINDKVVSSTYIKELLGQGDLSTTNSLLEEPFKIKSKVINGRKLGHKIGFPTANMVYPERIVKLPYGVYNVKFNNKPAVLNWGKKPTVDNSDEILELHIPNFDADLYGQELSMEILNKIRDEKKFASLEELKMQIKKDVEECLRL